MIEIRLIKTLEEFQVLMPLFIEGYHEMNRKQLVFDVDLDGYVDTLIGVLNTVPKNVIGVAFDDGMPVGFGVGFDDTPSFCKSRHLLLWALYVRRSHSKAVGPMLVRAAENWGKAMGYSVMHAFNARFSGASFNFFEKILGFRRSKIKFTKQLL